MDFHVRTLSICLYTYSTYYSISGIAIAISENAHFWRLLVLGKHSLYVIGGGAAAYQEFSI